jgi:NAD(P)-dependent dehydrogenase (short-subunit alcohol dehydrogenase family)
VARTVLVTGGSNGIGRAIAARFAAAGEQVIITGRNENRLKQAAADLGARGVACDHTVPAQVTRLAGLIGPELDVLVNNAGGNTDFTARGSTVRQGSTGPDHELEQVAAGWRANLDANLLSAVLTVQAVAGLLRPGGSVISIGSIGAEKGAGSYGAAKAALAAWNIGASAELGPRGITANVISAGYIEGTDFFRGQLADARRDNLIAATHDHRPGRVDDIAATTYFLASPGARHLTAQLIHVNGGAFVTR